jgi:hypothetical protein
MALLAQINYALLHTCKCCWHCLLGACLFSADSTDDLPILPMLILTTLNALCLYHCANAPGSTGEAAIEVLGASVELFATLKMQLPCSSMEDSARSCLHA